MSKSKRNELTEKIWALTDTSISGYNKLVKHLLAQLSISDLEDLLKEYFDEGEGGDGEEDVSDDDESDEEDVEDVDYE